MGIHLGKRHSISVGGSAGRWSSYWTKLSELWAKGRNGTEFIDKFGNNPKILLPVTQTNIGVRLTTAILPVANSLLVANVKMLTNAEGGGIGAGTGINARFYFTVNASGNWKLGYANKLVDSTIPVTNEWKTIVMCNGKIWIVPIQKNPSDVDIFNIMSEEPTIQVVSPTFGVADTNYIKINSSGSTSNTRPMEIAFSYHGTLTGSVITWISKFVFDGYNAQVCDIISHNVLQWDQPAGIVRSFSENGSQYCLISGYSRFTKSGAIDYYVPYIAGIPDATPTIPDGYIHFKDYQGSETGHNIFESKIRFVNDFFDRSNATIWNSICRAASDYDSVNTKDFNISNLNFKTLIGWLNVGYAGSLFLKVVENSIVLVKRELLTEIILTKIDQTGNSEIKALIYTGDIDQAVISENGEYIIDDTTNYVVIND